MFTRTSGWIALLTLILIMLGQSVWGQTAGGQARPQPTRQAQPVRQTSAQQAELARPFPPLSAQHLAYIDQILAYWEQKSSQVKRYRCTFRRWEYDPVFGPREVDAATGQKFAKTREKGEIKYLSPDKGLFQVTEILHYQKPANPQASSWVQIPGEQGEHWVCDGTTVYEFDHRKKTLIERRLPPEMHGKAIADGPLPFLFGAEKDKIKARYWIRVVTPPNVTKEYWLEAYPKRREDAANFVKLRIIIDEAQWLPLAIQVFPRGYDPRRNPAWTSYLFENREVNWNQLTEQLNIFKRAFYRPAAPSGWRKEIQNYGGPAPRPSAQVQGPSRPPARQVQGPQPPRR